MADLWTPTPPYKAETCSILNDHCQHWGMSDEQHVVLHVQVRLIKEVADKDAEAGLYEVVGSDTIRSSGSTTSIEDDARRFLELLADEGGWRLTR